jgi:hypothetical protein
MMLIEEQLPQGRETVFYDLLSSTVQDFFMEVTRMAKKRTCVFMFENVQILKICSVWN